MKENNNSETQQFHEDELQPKVTGIGGIFFFCENTQKTKDWYSQFDNKQSGSGAWDLFLSSDILHPKIGYFDFFVPGWKELDIIGKDEINNLLDNIKLK